MKAKKLAKNYLLILLISSFLFMFYFVFNIQEPNYFLCNEIILYEYEFLDNEFTFSYPKSCDQEFYHEGFTDFKNVFS